MLAISDFIVHYPFIFVFSGVTKLPVVTHPTSINVFKIFALRTYEKADGGTCGIEITFEICQFYICQMREATGDKHEL